MPIGLQWNAWMMALAAALPVGFVMGRTASAPARRQPVGPPAEEPPLAVDADRLPCNAGTRYPEDRDALAAQVRSLIPNHRPRARAISCLVPHDSYELSGAVAGAVYGALEVPERVIILAPSHTGRGRPLAVMTHGAWQTPLGKVEIDSDLAADLRGRFRALTDDAEAHCGEWGIEVQLPFLQVLRPDVRIVPISVAVGHYEPLAELGYVLASITARATSPPLLIASSDLNHFDPDPVTREKDARLLEAFCAMDPRAFFDAVGRTGSTMCGYGPATAALFATAWLGAQSAEVVKYSTSAEVSGGSHEAAVGYGGVVFR